MSKIEKNNLPELYNHAMEIAATYDVSTPPSRLVLYSVSFLPSKENQDKATNFINDNHGFVVIENTPCGSALDEMNLVHSGLNSEQIAEIWAVASARTIAAASGNITTFVEGADPRSVFRRIELPGILKNPEILTIDGIDKQTFADTYFK